MNQTVRQPGFMHAPGSDCRICKLPIVESDLVDWFKQAAEDRPDGKPDPYPNPEGGDTWYHGTRSNWGEGAPAGPLALGQEPSHWNTALGAHFTPLHSTAHNFVSDPHVSPSGPQPGSRIAHVKLHMKNPAFYPDERQLGIDFLHKSGAEDDGFGSYAGHDYDPAYPCKHCDDKSTGFVPVDEHDQWDVGHDYEPDHSWKPSCGECGYGEDMCKRINQSDFDHDIKRELGSSLPEYAEKFKNHLKAKGHDGIIYGNSYEAPIGHKCAIAFDDTRVTVKKWENFEDGSESDGEKKATALFQHFAGDSDSGVGDRFSDEMPEGREVPPNAVGYEPHEDEFWVSCGKGHTHYGEHGAAGMLIRHTDDEGNHRYLLQKRAPWVDHGNTWGVPGGAIRKGENPEEAAMNETKEEIGHLPGLKPIHRYTDDHDGWAYHTIVAQAPERFNISDADQNDESSGTGWFTREEMNKLPLHPGFASSVDKVIGSVGKTATLNNLFQHFALTYDEDGCDYCGNDNDDIGIGPHSSEDHEDHIAEKTPQPEDLKNMNSINRYVNVSLTDEDHSIIHDKTKPVEFRARHLLNHLQQGVRGVYGGLGSHWAHPKADKHNEEFSWGALPRKGNPISVKISAEVPEHHQIEDDGRNLVNNGFWGYQDPEWEVPLKYGTSVNVNSVSWREDDDPWTTHNFDKPVKHTAARDFGPNKGPLPIQHGLYYRVHYTPRKWETEKATSTPGLMYKKQKEEYGDRTEPGYSSFDNPHDLHRYWDGKYWAGEKASTESQHQKHYKNAEDWFNKNHKVVIFKGEEVGRGHDQEPLVQPTHKADRQELSTEEFKKRLSQTPHPDTFDHWHEAEPLDPGGHYWSGNWWHGNGEKCDDAEKCHEDFPAPSSPGADPDTFAHYWDNHEDDDSVTHTAANEPKPLTKLQEDILYRVKKTGTVDMAKDVHNCRLYGDQQTFRDHLGNIADELGYHNGLKQKDVDAVSKHIENHAQKTLIDAGFPETFSVWRKPSPIERGVLSVTTQTGGTKTFRPANEYKINRSDVLTHGEEFLGDYQSFAEDELHVPLDKMHLVNERTASMADYDVTYHLTDNPHFALNPEHQPEDNALSISPRTRKGLYTTEHPESWVNGHDYVRPYLVEIHTPKGVAQDERWGGEKFVPAEHFGEAKVHRVIPLDAHVREKFGSPGWIEEHHGDAFETGKPLRRGESGGADHRQFLGYHYDGPDVRDMTPEQHQHHYDRWKGYMTGARGFGHNEFDDAKQTMTTPKDEDFDGEGMFIRRDQHGHRIAVLDSWRPNQRLFAPTIGSLDPRLFEDDKIRPEVRNFVMDRLAGLWDGKYDNWREWSRVYLAGSSISEWWADVNAIRDPEIGLTQGYHLNDDLDTLIGVEYGGLVEANPQFAGMSPKKVSAHMNAELREFCNMEGVYLEIPVEGVPEWEWSAQPVAGKVRVGPWGATWYVNPNSYDIRAIKPYAAYDLTRDEWAVRPVQEPTGHQFSPTEWYYFEGVAQEVKGTLALPEPARSRRAKRLWNFIHSTRNKAFTPSGSGVFDFRNVVEKYLDQAGLWQPLVEAQFPDQKTAGANGNLPEGIQFEHSEDEHDHHITARAPGANGYIWGDEGIVGRLSWTKHDLDPDTSPIHEISLPLDAGTVTGVDVHPDYQRRGIASAMWEQAKIHADRLQAPGPYHSELQTDEGQEWAARTATALKDGVLQYDHEEAKGRYVREGSRFFAGKGKRRDRSRPEDLSGDSSPSGSTVGPDDESRGNGQVPRTIVYGSAAKRDLKKLEVADRQNAYKTVDRIANNEPNLQTHGIKQLPGILTTKINRRWRVLHSSGDNNELIVHGITLHDYDEMVRRMTSREQSQ